MSHVLVYTSGGQVTHLLREYQSPNNATEPALCGRSVWPDYWRGTGTQDEYDKALDMPLCIGCRTKLLNT